jgi:hypothetical protein
MAVLVSTQLGVGEIFRVEKWPNDFGSLTPKLLMAGQKRFWGRRRRSFFRLQQCDTKSLPGFRSRPAWKVYPILVKLK